MSRVEGRVTRPEEPFKQSTNNETKNLTRDTDRRINENKINDTRQRGEIHAHKGILFRHRWQ